MIIDASVHTSPHVVMLMWASQPRPACMESAFPHIARAGTGGIEPWTPPQVGYQQKPVVRLVEQGGPPLSFVSLMETVREGFGRTMNRLPAVFGVSRQALYDWLKGASPNEIHHEKIRQLAAAAAAFAGAGFKPTPHALDRVVSNGKSLLQLIGEGADGAATAESFIKVVRRGEVAKRSLGAMLGQRRAPLEVSDYGSPAYDEA